MHFDPDRIWWPGWRVACAFCALGFGIMSGIDNLPWLGFIGGAVWGFSTNYALEIALTSSAELNEEDE